MFGKSTSNFRLSDSLATVGIGPQLLSEDLSTASVVIGTACGVTVSTVKEDLPIDGSIMVGCADTGITSVIVELARLNSGGYRSVKYAHRGKDKEFESQVCVM